MTCGSVTTTWTSIDKITISGRSSSIFIHDRDQIMTWSVCLREVFPENIKHRVIASLIQTAEGQLHSLGTTSIDTLFIPNTDARSFRCAAEAAYCIAQAVIYLIDMIDRSRKVRHSSSTDLIFNGSIPSYTVIYLISQYLPPGRSSLYIFKRYFSAAAWAWLRLNIIIDFSNQSRIRHSNNPIGQRSCLQVINSGLSRKN